MCIVGYGELPTPTWSGYRFDGWFTSANGGTQVTSSTTVDLTADQTLYAHWTASYTVTFDSQGGSAVTAQTVASGGKVTKPADPTRSGYSFGGWFKEAACTSAWNFASDTVTTNVTLYAKWTADTPGTDTPGSGDSTGGDVSFELVVKDEKTPDVDVDGLEEIAAQVGKEEGEKVTVTFTVEAVTDPTDKADIEKAVTGSRDDILYLDMTLTKTVTRSSGNSTQSEITDTGDAILEIAVPYDFQGKKDVTVYRGHSGKVEILTLVRDGESKRDGVFRLDQENGLVFIYAGKFSTYAISYTSEVKQTGYTVTFNSQGGSAIAAQTVTNGSKVTKPADPTRNGYSFGGWFKDAACTNEWKFDSDIVTGNVTLYAKWNADTPGTDTPDTPVEPDTPNIPDKPDTPDIPDVIPVTGVSLNKTSLSLTVGSSERLTATVAPSNADNKNVTWTSSDSTVATVSNGTVTAVKAGTTTITVKTADGGYAAACTVTVTASSGGNTGGDTKDTYAIWIDSWIRHGEVYTSHTYAEPGTLVTITVYPDTDYMVDWVDAERDDGRYLSVDQSGSRYTFIMPASNVTVYASFSLDEYIYDIWDGYEVWVASGIQNGDIYTSRTFAEPGTRVTITVDPDSYYALDWIRAEREDNGRTLSLSKSGSRYTFTMPYSDVVIDAGFALQVTYSTTTSPQSQTTYNTIRPVKAPTTLTVVTPSKIK